MGKAIGMVEYQTISTGILAADTMIKTAHIKIIEANTVCPGKYLVLFTGDLSAVTAAIEVGKNRFSDKVIDSFILGNPHDSLIPGLYGTGSAGIMQAIGTLETFSVATAIAAADDALKTANVELVELRVARGMCGKSFFVLTGKIAEVDAAISKARSLAGAQGMLLDYSIIANPDPQLAGCIR